MLHAIVEENTCVKKCAFKKSESYIKTCALLSEIIFMTVTFITYKSDSGFEKNSNQRLELNNSKNLREILYVHLLFPNDNKYQPLHLGLTQRWTLLRYCTRLSGILSLSQQMSLVLTTRAANSNNEGGLCVISDTNLTTSGLSRRDNYEKSMK